MAHAWEDIENAIQRAVAQATGLASDSVIWKYQNFNQPDFDYATVDLGDLITIGQDFVKYSTDLTRPNGQEIKQRVVGLREVSLEIEVFTADRLGNESAKPILERARTALRLPSIKHALNVAGLSPFDLGAVHSLPYIPSVNFRGRAVCSIRCNVITPEVVEYCGYISRVRGTATWYTASGVTGGQAIFDSANG